MDSDFRIGDWMVQPQLGILTKGDYSVSLKPKTMEVLVYFSQHQGEVLPKEKFIRDIWKEAFVTDEVLTNAISEIRKVIKDNPRNPKFIQTIPKKGYRLIADVKSIPIDRNDDIRVNEVKLFFNLSRSRIFVLVLIFALVGFWFWKWRFQSKNLSVDSIAVLPFRNLSADPELDWFADSMTDILITQIGKLSPVQVISLQSVTRFKGVDVSLSEIGKKLGVDTVLEGGVLLSEDKVRITAQLISLSPERNLWAESYDRPLKDIIQLQNEIAGAVAKEIDIALKTPVQPLFKEEQHDYEAYIAYLKGKYFWNQRTEESVEKSIEHFQMALAKDQNLAEAHAGLAQCYHSTGKIPEAWEEVEKALEIDSNLSEAHISLGLLQHTVELDVIEAENEYALAVELNPNSDEARMFHSFVLIHLGRFQEGISEAKHAYQLEPLMPIINMGFAAILYYSRSYERALEKIRETIELDPEFAGSYQVLGLIYEQMGQYEKAIENFQKNKELMQLYPVLDSMIAHSLAKAGEVQKAREILDDLLNSDPVDPYWIARIHIGLGEKNAALDWLERAYEQRYLAMPSINADPVMDPLRNETRFEALLKKLNLVN